MGKKVDSLLNFYTDVLSSLYIQSDTEGLLTLIIPQLDDDEAFQQPCTINEKRLVLPTPERLRTGQWDGMMAFHPLSEHDLRGESEVFQYLRKAVLFRLRSTTAQLMASLLDLAVDKDRHKDLTPRQAEFLTLLPDANEKTLKAFSKILSKHMDKLLNVYMQRFAKHGNTEYRRVAAVSFPIWEELTSKGSMVYDVDVGSVKNKRTLSALFEFVFEDPDNPDAWSFGSNVPVAPYFQALLGGYHKLGTRLNALVHKYRKHIEAAEILRMDMDWYDQIKELESLKTAIPALPGNKGAQMKGERELDEVASDSTPSPRKRPAWQPDPAKIANQVHQSHQEETPPFEPDPQPVPSHYRSPEPSQQESGRTNWRQMSATLNRQQAQPSGWNNQPPAHTMLQPRPQMAPAAYGGQMRPWSTGGGSSHLSLQPRRASFAGGGMYPGQL